MYLYIELWRAKDAWFELSVAQREAKINELFESAKRNPIAGVIPLNFRDAGNMFVFDRPTEQPMIIDDDVARPTGFRYANVWMIPTVDLIKKFEDRVESLGWWFEYFDQQNAWGVMDVKATVNDMINSRASAAPAGAQPSARLGRLGRAEKGIYDLLQGVGELRNMVADLKARR